MRVLLAGGSGMLGSDLLANLREAGHEATAPSHSEMDVTDPSSVGAALSVGKFDWCVNCTAYTAVDAAESNVDAAVALNTLAPSYMARASMGAGARFLHISTDFVFDGDKDDPYHEEDVPNPLGVYGRTKLEGEEAVAAANPDSIVLRTSWLFGPNGNSFPRTMIQAARTGKTLKVVEDQRGSPTYTGDLAQLIAKLAESQIHGGIYHAGGPDAMSWHELAVLAIDTDRKLSGDFRTVEIEALKTSDWPTPARRPKNSVLISRRLDRRELFPTRSIADAMRDFVARLSLEH